MGKQPACFGSPNLWLLAFTAAHNASTNRGMGFGGVLLPLLWRLH
jgi:hypothetical protein